MFRVININMYSKLFLICAFALAVTSQEQLKVTLFYEGLCPSCHNFFIEQLYPGFKKLGNALDIDLVSAQQPENNGSQIEWSCQHGPKECYINKVSACAIHVSDTQSKMMEFENCFLKDSDIYKSQEYEEDLAKKCAAGNDLPWDKINSCLDKEVDKILLAYEQRLKKVQPPIQYVPAILFNDKRDEDTENAAREDFVATACQLFKTKPKACLKTFF
ncbi:unnamed protein product [Phyllotreta striolata]|uniref:Gamma-interferon-inducible lysosomal thiol reductase n=1 Tax=Phyllotreta striolata TaxID=444603 RepID=A0A9N9TGD0_PHYSR|nr:unnamed protein product [Phyllotreta striolata]